MMMRLSKEKLRKLISEGGEEPDLSNDRTAILTNLSALSVENKELKKRIAELEAQIQTYQEQWPMGHDIYMELKDSKAENKRLCEQFNSFLDEVIRVKGMSTNLVVLAKALKGIE